MRGLPIAAASLLLLLLICACSRPDSPSPPKVPASSLRPAGAGDGLWQDAAIFDAVRSMMQAARDRVWVEMYEFGRADLAAAMSSARSRGADVRLVYDPSVSVSRGVASSLHRMGVEARSYPLDDRRFQIDHVKLLLTDSTGMVGGMNWGSHSSANHDYAIETHEVAALRRLEAIFEHDWALAGARPGFPVANAAAGPGPAPAGLDVLQTTPGDGIRQALSFALAAARRSIQAEVFVLTDPDVIAALAAASGRGVRVRMLLDPNQDVNRPTYSLLQKSGVAVRWYAVPPGAKLHAKAGLFDGRLIVGSANWSRSGLSVNHELDLQTDDPSIAAPFANRFAADWAAAG